MGQDSFRAVCASKTISEDLSLKRASPGFGFRQQECATSRREFLCNNFPRHELSSRQEHYRDFVPGRILAGIPEESFFLGGISASTDFSARFSAGIFPGKDPAGKMGHLGEIPAGSR